MKRLSTTTNINLIANANDEKIINRSVLKKAILTAGFPQIFSNKFILGMGDSVVNFHPSFLPRCRGAHPIYWTIAKREPFGGVSSHLVTENIDAGPLISRQRIDFDPQSITYDILYRMIIEEVPKVLDDTVHWLKCRPQNTFIELDLEPTFFREDQPEDHKIDWSEDELEVISAKIRAGKAFCYLSASKEKLRLLPPVSYCKYHDYIEQQVLIKHQEKDHLYIETPRGLLAASCHSSPIKKHHFYSKLLNKLKSYIVLRKLVGEELI